MLKIVLETTVLHEDYKLSKASLIELLNIARLGNAQVVIPQVVLDEHISHFNRDRKKCLSETKSAIKSLRRFPLIEIPNFEIAQLEQTYDEFLTTMVASRHMEIINYPQVNHVDVLKRCISKRRPFGEETDTGYKDTLIWETILQMLRDNPEDRLLFVTNDRDYQKKSTKSLHSQFVDELIGLGYPDDVVNLKVSLKAASDYLREKFGLQSADLIPAVVTQINENIDFNEFLTANTAEIEHCILEDSESILRGDPLSDPSLLWNVEDVKVEIESTEVLDNGEVVVYAEAEFENEVMYWTFYSSFACEEDSMSEYGISLYDVDEDIDSAWIGGWMNLRLKFNFVYEPSNNEVSGFESLEISRIDVPSYS